MSINIYLMKKDLLHLDLIGSLDDEQIISINKEAIKKKLNCFSGLDYIGYTIYNHKQISEIKYEIIKLKDSNELSAALEIIKTAIAKIASNNEYYLVFEGE